MTEVQERERTHRMVVADPREDATEPRVVEWNGQPAERAEAERRFNEAMATGMFLAYATTITTGGTKKHEQIRGFDPEAEQITLTPRLAGGAA